MAQCAYNLKQSIMRNISRLASREIPEEIIHGVCELDLHADTCVAGPNCIMLEYTNHAINVSAYSDELEQIKDTPIVTTATAYDDPRTGTTYILIMGQAIYMGDKVSASSLCPNQL
jgi:hypothetical protein